MNTKQFSAIISEGQSLVLRELNTNVNVEKDTMGSCPRYEKLLKFPNGMYDIFITLDLCTPPFLISSNPYYPRKLLGGVVL